MPDRAEKRICRVTDQERDLLFVQREEQFHRMPFSMEEEFFSLILRGDEAGVAAFSQTFPGGAVPVGNLSCSDLRQAQYQAVAFATLMTRAAIHAGAFEADAYSMSDEFILRIDRMADAAEVEREIIRMGGVFAHMVAEADSYARYSRVVRGCMEYVHAHLHERLTNAALAEECGVSAQYLARKFREERGCTVGEWIRREKMREAVDLLRKGELNGTQIAALLGFSSQSHFIACFRRFYNATPRVFQTLRGWENDTLTLRRRQENP